MGRHVFWFRMSLPSSSWHKRKSIAPEYVFLFPNINMHHFVLVVVCESGYLINYMAFNASLVVDDAKKLC